MVRWVVVLVTFISEVIAVVGAPTVFPISPGSLVVSNFIGLLLTLCVIRSFLLAFKNITNIVLFCRGLFFLDQRTAYSCGSAYELCPAAASSHVVRKDSISSRVIAGVCRSPHICVPMKQVFSDKSPDAKTVLLAPWTRRRSLHTKQLLWKF